MNKNCKVGFIGCGKMASAIIKGVISSGFLPKDRIKGAEINPEVAQCAQNRLGIDVITDNKALVIDSDVIFIATKPNYVTDILEEIKSELTTEKLLVSIAAGVSTKKIENVIGQNRVIRVMPNTPALVLEGMSGVCKGAFANTEPVQYLIKYEGDTSNIKAMLKEMTYSEGEKDYGAEIQTFYGVFLPAENFYEDIVKIAFAVSLVLMVFSVLLFMSFLSASIERRKRELGILRALGARKLDVVNICLIESMIVALINFALSLPGVYIVCAVLNVNFLLSVFNVGVLQIMVLLMICFGVAALATILPVYKMMRRQPVDIIRESQP